MQKLFTTLCLAVVGLLATIPIRAEIQPDFFDGEFGYYIIAPSLNQVALIEYIGAESM